MKSKFYRYFMLYFYRLNIVIWTLLFSLSIGCPGPQEAANPSPSSRPPKHGNNKRPRQDGKASRQNHDRFGSEDNGIFEVGSSISRAEAREMIREHNRARALVGVEPLVWDAKLAAYAQEWSLYQATKLGRMAHRGAMSGTPEPPYGENLAWSLNMSLSPTDVVRAWSDEEKPFYDYHSNTCKPGEQCGHHTQVVWSTTQRVGCGRIQTFDSQEYWTCSYDPPGNYIGQRPY